MPSQMDMASALELTLEPDQETKFQALKNLQSKKIKYLMTSIDAKDKELAKLKVMGKDNRRTQMIQALKNKLRDQELVSDVTKEELSRRNEMSLDEVNAYIMRKTLGGPKRFRPLSREELETKISELERKLKRSTDGSSRTTTNSQSVNNVVSSSSSNISKIYDEKTSFTTGDLSTIAKLADELQNLRVVLNSKDATIEQQKGDIFRLRTRNTELRVADEEMDFQDRKYREIKSAFDQIIRDLDEVSEKFSLSSEENILLKGELSSENEISRSKIDELQDQCQKLLRQNSSVLKSMATLEHDLDKALSDLSLAGSARSSNAAGDAAHANALAALESKMFRVTEKLKISDEKNQELTIENNQISLLKETLRERNNNIKDLKRSLEERDKTRSSAPTDGSTAEMRIKISDLMSENRTLKQALAAATMGVRASMDRIGK